MMIKNMSKITLEKNSEKKTSKRQGQVYNDDKKRITKQNKTREKKQENKQTISANPQGDRDDIQAGSSADLKKKQEKNKNKKKVKRKRKFWKCFREIFLTSQRRLCSQPFSQKGQ